MAVFSGSAGPKHGNRHKREKRETESHRWSKTQTVEGFRRQKTVDRKRRTVTEEGLRGMTEA